MKKSTAATAATSIAGAITRTRTISKATTIGIVKNAFRNGKKRPAVGKLKL